MRAVDCAGEGIATSNGTLANALDRLVDLSNREVLSGPEFNRLRSLARRMTSRLAKQGDANPQIIHAVDQASAQIASLDPAQIGINRAVIEAMRAMFRLRRATSESLRGTRSEGARRRPRDQAAASVKLDGLPTLVDLRSASVDPGQWEQIGPNTVDAISACVRDVRRWSKPSGDVEPSQVILHYGDRIITGTAPVDPCTILAEPALDAAGAPARANGGEFVLALDPSTVVDGDEALASWDDPVGAPRPIPSASHQTTRSNVPILQQLKTTLKDGQPFAFLFLAVPPFSPAARSTPSAGVDSNPQMTPGCPHTATAVGYDDNAQAFIIVDPCHDGARPATGSLFLSYAYVTNPVLAQDVWTIRSNNGADARRAARSGR